MILSLVFRVCATRSLTAQCPFPPSIQIIIETKVHIVTNEKLPTTTTTAYIKKLKLQHQAT